MQREQQVQREPARTEKAPESRRKQRKRWKSCGGNLHGIGKSHQVRTVGSDQGVVAESPEAGAEREVAAVDSIKDQGPPSPVESDETADNKSRVARTITKPVKQMQQHTARLDDITKEKPTTCGATRTVDKESAVSDN